MDVAEKMAGKKSFVHLIPQCIQQRIRFSLIVKLPLSTLSISSRSFLMSVAAGMPVTPSRMTPQTVSSARVS